MCFVLSGDILKTVRSNLTSVRDGAVACFLVKNIFHQITKQSFT